MSGALRIIGTLVTVAWAVRLGVRALWFAQSLHRSVGDEDWRLPADLVEAARRRPHGAPREVLTIPLQKQEVPILVGGRTVAQKTAYFGSLWVGRPAQELSVVFDTGSGNLVLPSTDCRDDACLHHRRYDRAASSTAASVQKDGTPYQPWWMARDELEITYGSGKVAGSYGREVICVGPQPTGCVVTGIVAASEMSSEPFGRFQFDGVLGLGLGALAANSHFSFFGQMVAQDPDMLPQFAVYLARSEGVQSEITFGGHEERLASSDIFWAPVVMQQQGFWQVHIE